MHCEIAIAGVKPGGFAELPHGLQAEKRIALDAPSALAAEQAREDVGDRINIWGNVESPPKQIIASIHHHGDVFGRDDLPKSIDELGTAGSASKHADHAALVSLSLSLSLARPSTPRVA